MEAERMRRVRAAWTTMSTFMVALTVLLATAVVGGRHAAWSFSVDVPSPILASMTARHMPVAGSTTGAQPGVTQTTGTNPNAPGAPVVQDTNVNPAAPNGGPGANSTDSSTPRAGSKWPAIILGVVCVIGLVLIILYFVTRNNED